MITELNFRKFRAYFNRIWLRYDAQIVTHLDGAFQTCVQKANNFYFIKLHKSTMEKFLALQAPKVDVCKLKTMEARLFFFVC